ncbi:MAG: hypothetical protein VB031_09460 [Eubacteriaceae bacterium]|nr:hypothetical protein [Eubacteriaceae bacterium]
MSETIGITGSSRKIPGTGTGVYVSMDYGYSYEVISAYDDIRLYVLLSSDTAYRIKALYKRRVDNGLITRCIKDTDGNTWYLGGQISSSRVDGTGDLCLKI